MNWVTLVGDLLLQSLKLWNTKEANKYKDRYLGLRNDLWEAENAARIDHALIDNIKRSIYDLVKVASDEIKGVV